MATTNEIHNPFICLMLLYEISLDEIYAEYENGNHSQFISDNEDTIIDRIDKKRDKKRIEAFVKDLPRHEKDVVKQIYYEDAERAETAKKLKKTRQAVEKILKRVHRKGEKKLEKLNPKCA